MKKCQQNVGHLVQASVCRNGDVTVINKCHRSLEQEGAHFSQNFSSMPQFKFKGYDILLQSTHGCHIATFPHAIGGAAVTDVQNLFVITLSKFGWEQNSIFIEFKLWWEIFPSQFKFDENAALLSSKYQIIYKMEPRLEIRYRLPIAFVPIYPCSTLWHIPRVLAQVHFVHMENDSIHASVLTLACHAQQNTSSFVMCFVFFIEHKKRLNLQCIFSIHDIHRCFLTITYLCLWPNTYWVLWHNIYDYCLEIHWPILILMP